MKKIGCIVIIAILAIGVCFIMKFKNSRNIIDTNIDGDNIEIEYQTSGGFGLMSDTEPVCVVINNQKAIIKYKDKIKKDISYSKSDYSELVELIKEKFKYISKDAGEDTTVMDGSSSSITIRNKNTGEEQTAGGYMPEDENYNEIEDKIYDVIGSDTISNFRDNELTKYFE